jgi:hypothetical protein
MDFKDLDVIWNVRLFYQCAGYEVSSKHPDSTQDLLVILRGNPGEQFQEHSGDVHIYDYVKELQVDWKTCFPKAQRIFLVSLFEPTITDPGIKWVRGYLPVIPELWQQKPFRKKEERPLHIGNFKPLGIDTYQQDLIRLARRGHVRIHGANWDKQDIRTSGLSYWEANHLLAESYSCYGLMYPYQRGTTLSGRMWQAPLHGCMVISEKGTNPLNLPGILEVDRFSPETLLSVSSILECQRIRTSATHFWLNATEQIAHQLGLVLGRPSAAQVSACRRSMLAQHLRVVLTRRLAKAGRSLALPPLSCWIQRQRRTLQRLWRFLRQPRT